MSGTVQVQVCYSGPSGYGGHYSVLKAFINKELPGTVDWSRSITATQGTFDVLVGGTLVHSKTQTKNDGLVDTAEKKQKIVDAIKAQM